VKTLSLWERISALGQIDPEMLNPIKQKFGPGQRTKVRCTLCRVRVRKWRFHERKQALFSCDCVLLSLFDGGLQLDGILWKAVAELAQAYGYLECNIPTPGFEPVKGGPFSPN
jgi:hypothetical protein